MVVLPLDQVRRPPFILLVLNVRYSLLGCVYYRAPKGFYSPANWLVRRLLH